MPVAQQIEDQTDIFAFLKWQLGMGKARRGVNGRVAKSSWLIAAGRW